jgi:carbamoylphosphate synthase large subunit
VICTKHGYYVEHCRPCEAGWGPTRGGLPDVAEIMSDIREQATKAVLVALMRDALAVLHEIESMRSVRILSTRREAIERARLRVRFAEAIKALEAQMTPATQTHISASEPASPGN